MESLSYLTLSLFQELIVTPSRGIIGVKWDAMSDEISWHNDSVEFLTLLLFNDLKLPKEGLQKSDGRVTP